MLDVEALGALSEHFPELGPYVYPLKSWDQQQIGFGRIRMMQWQVVYQHMLIMRRQWCHDKKLNFHETEKKVEAKIRRAKILTDPVVHWMLVVAGTYAEAYGDQQPYKDILEVI